MLTCQRGAVQQHSVTAQDGDPPISAGAGERGMDAGDGGLLGQLEFYRLAAPGAGAGNAGLANGAVGDQPQQWSQGGLGDRRGARRERRSHRQVGPGPAVAEGADAPTGADTPAG